MAVLPVISGWEAVRAFEKISFKFHHQKSSHIILYHSNGRHLSVPDHRELDRGTLRALIRGAGITVEEFVQLLSCYSSANSELLSGSNALDSILPVPQSALS